MKSKIQYQISFVRAFNDNYIWIIHDNNSAVVIDPGCHVEVQKFLTCNNLKLSAIILTHLHADHNGGVDKLLHLYPNASIYSNHDLQMRDNDIIQVESFPNFKILTTPGHVYEHVCYLFDDIHLFCGDTLFSLGCGRVFTGDFAIAFDSLQKLRQLNDDVLCYPAHEYTLNNLAFCMSLQADKYQNLYDDIENKLNKYGISLPVSIGYEKEFNPFLLSNNLESFKELRELRNKF